MNPLGLLRVNKYRVNVTPDGLRYLAMGKGDRAARPYHLRWLLPALAKTDVCRWAWASRLSVVLLGLLGWWFTGSVWMASAVALPGVLFNWRYPVLVDATGMVLALFAACLWPICWPAALLVVLVAGMTRETGPVWAALWAWNPVLLVGLIPVGLRWLQTQGVEQDPSMQRWVEHPVLASWFAHWGRWREPQFLLVPWAGLLLGVAVLAPWTVNSTRLAIGLVLGYGQLLVAHDEVRLYQWAWPSLALACTQALPSQLLPFVALSIIFNPWREPIGGR